MKKIFSNIIILIIIFLGTFFWSDYSNNKALDRIKSINDNILKSEFEYISDILGEYKDADMENKISLASNLSYSLSEASKFFYDSSFLSENDSLKNILYEFESNIKKNNMGILLGNDIPNDLSILFKELSINPSDTNISGDINKILSVYWK